MNNLMIINELKWNKDLEIRQQIDQDRKNGDRPLELSTRRGMLWPNWIARPTRKQSGDCQENA